MVGIATGCKKKDILLSNIKEITAFKIEAAHNTESIKIDINGEISGNSIVLPVSKGLNVSSLKATFTITGKSVTVKGSTQQSTISVQDFSLPVKYVITAEDGSEQTYTVTIRQVDDPGLILNAFSILKTNNPDLPADLNFTIKGNKATAKLKYFKQKLIATFSTQATSVTIDGIVQESGKTVVDFSQPVKYTLTSRYGTKAEYLLSIDWEASVPRISITTAGNAPIVSKDDYLQATIKIEGLGGFQDYSGTTRIKGREI
ncbi:hypothetical protein [Pedobacter steynii]